ncbi:LacI family DNA-binding transcriptional regulator [Herbiconiux daphne]|uniref:LacI family DNA-binding transcriptional regulator n=1 Tax=Herbiconiux daphne TaxID=2970914 RepID=UPI002877F4BA|nr:LacI family DNA-binding transcriptional regulator [Herbiconiux daphne]
MADRARAVTIADVAARAGVSQASVSRVLNSKQTVDPRIVKLVRTAIADLGYTPSIAARSLVHGRNDTIAMVVPDLENPLFQGILKGLSLAAAADGYRVLVADTAEQSDEEAAIALEARHRCDAIVLCAPRMPESQLRALAPQLAPVVVVNRSIADSAVPMVGVDYAQGMRDLVAHLVSLGHQRLLFLGGPARSSSNVERLRGLREAVAATPGLAADVVACGSSLDDGYRAAEAVADAVRGGVTGVIAFNDLVALGLVPRLGQLGLAVPRDVSVAGFDDVPLARFSSPALTSMSVPRAELGAQVWSRLRDLIAGESAEHAMLYRPRLEARASTGPVPGAAGGGLAPDAAAAGGESAGPAGAAVDDGSDDRPNDNGVKGREPSAGLDDHGLLTEAPAPAMDARDEGASGEAPGAGPDGDGAQISEPVGADAGGAR